MAMFFCLATLSVSFPDRFSPVERTPSTHWIGDRVGPRAGLDNVEKRKSRPYRDSNSDPSAVQLVAGSHPASYTLVQKTLKRWTVSMTGRGRGT
jgi:hypothetical protein